MRARFLLLILARLQACSFIDISLMVLMHPLPPNVDLSTPMWIKKRSVGQI